MRLKKAKIKNFLKEHWYWVAMALIGSIMIIIFIVLFFIRIENRDFPTNCKPAPDPTIDYISEVSIGSNEAGCSSTEGLCCPQVGGQGLGWVTFGIKGVEPEYINTGSGGKPDMQICYTSASEFCDQDTVVTDMKFVDMTDTSDKNNPKYKDSPLRCCDKGDNTCTYFPPLAVNLPNPSEGDVGTLPDSVSGCKKMGLCIQKKVLGELRRTKGRYLPANSVSFVVTSDPGLKTGTDVCRKILQDNKYISDDVNLYNGCDTKNRLYLCKKYTNVQ